MKLKFQHFNIIFKMDYSRLIHLTWNMKIINLIRINDNELNGKTYSNYNVVIKSKTFVFNLF